ncbi:MAG: hypothetical protein Kow0058_18300 [Roseovarius sp.]
MMGFLWRLLAAFGLLAATFNPTEWNYVSWAGAHFFDQTPLAVLLGLLLVAGYIIYLRATLRSIGVFGMLMVMAITASAIWVLDDWGLLTLQDTSQLIWLALAALALVLGTGLSWSHVRRRLSGQADMDDVDE